MYPTMRASCAAAPAVPATPIPSQRSRGVSREIAVSLLTFPGWQIRTPVWRSSIYSVDAQNDLGIDVIGGKSASCPMFSALCALATQHAHRPLGQAAPRLYRLQSGAITDVVNSTSRNNV